MTKSGIRFSTYPRTEPPASFVKDVVDIFRKNESSISTITMKKGLTSDEALAVLRKDLLAFGFEVEKGKKKADKLERPVFFGENGIPTVRYEIDAYHPEWRCGLEVEAGRGWMGNAVYRDLILASVMVDVDYLILAVANEYKFQSGGKEIISNDYERTQDLCDVLFGHTRVRLPYKLAVIGY